MLSTIETTIKQHKHTPSTSSTQIETSFPDTIKSNELQSFCPITKLITYSPTNYDHTQYLFFCLFSMNFHFRFVPP